MNKSIPKKLKRRVGSIQSIITLSFTAIMFLAMLFIGITFYSTFSENAEKNATSSTHQIMDQATINLEYYLKSMTEISDLIQSNFNSVSEDNIQNIDELLRLTLELREDIVSVAIFTNTGEIFMTNPKHTYDSNFSVRQQEWFSKSLNNPREYIFQPPHVQRIFEDRRPWVVSLCQEVTIYDPAETLNYVAMVDMNFSTIEHLCSQVSLGKRGYIYIIDEQGNIIYHPQQQLIYAGLKKEDIESALSYEEGSYVEDFQNERRITTIKDIKYTNWKMVGVSYVDEIVENKKNLNTLIIVILLFAIAFEFAASILISAKISQPIKRLERAMKRVENGDFNISNIEVEGEDEVRRLTRTFNLMIARIKQLMDQIINEQEAKRKSELKALQAQINPHFLYNTLDSIIWMNENQQYTGVTNMVAALAKFFRISISKGNEIISVVDEVEHARSYLVIQKIRYKNKFNYTINVQDGVKDYKTLKLILQPIVENAIYHGINKIQEKGEITIDVGIEDGMLVYSVRDNGYGISPERLKVILDRESTSKHSAGVGMKNVNERIKLCYGSQYGIDIESELEVGTTIRIRIPLIEE